jgi:hypothetical protein
MQSGESGLGPKPVLRSRPVAVAKPTVDPMSGDVDRNQAAPKAVSVAGNVNPVSGRSVYDRRDQPSSLGLMPLAPLQPLQPIQSAAVYPGSSPAPRSTFVETGPTLAPKFPSAVEATPAVRSVSPIRFTSSSECDCGKQH